MATEFEQLIQIHRGRIRAIARRYADPSEQEDLFQEILEQLWRSFAGFRAEARPETWIYRIGFNTAMTRLRKTIKQREHASHRELPEQTTPGGQCQAVLLEGFMRTLNDIDVSILMMYLDGLSAKDIAGVLGLQTNAIQVRISRMKTAFSERYVEAP